MSQNEQKVNHEDHTISSLASEIARCRDLIQHYENRIMRAEIAVQVLLDMKGANEITIAEIQDEAMQKINVAPLKTLIFQ